MIVSKYGVDNRCKFNAFGQNVININDFRYLKSNLAPLSKDTVSFSGGSELTGACMKNSPAGNTCYRAHCNAQMPTYYLEKVLDKYLEPINKNSKQDEPPITYYVRTKSSGSINEKVCAKFGEIQKEEKEKFCDAAIVEILKHFKPSNELTVNKAKIASKISLEFTEDSLISPYKHEKFFLETILNDFEKHNLINSNRYSPEDKEKIIKEITEKLETVTSDKHCDEKGFYVDPSTMEGVKYYSKDIVGGRIILNDASVMPEILKALQKASDDGYLNITSVENKLPPIERIPQEFKLSDYEYIPGRKLKKFADKTFAKYDAKNSKTGYTAIHINLDLSNDAFKTKNNELNGFCGEIQIMDKYIEEFKEIEDLCYKTKSNKNFKDKKYKAFKEHFNKYHKDPKVKEAFKNYTCDLYLFQRQKSAFGIKKESSRFPDLEFLGYEKKLPKELDFNVLKDIKERCERKGKKNEQENTNNQPKTLKSFILSRGQVFMDTVRKLFLGLPR